MQSKLLPHDSTSRLVCGVCGEVSYSNPLILVTTIMAEPGGKILLCRRAEPPRAGFWTLPGGFMECGESLQQAAAREAYEETGIRLNPDRLRFYAITSLIDISQVYVGFVAHLEDAIPPVCGTECQEVRYFDESDLPWEGLAYPDVKRYLRAFFRESRSGDECTHFGHLDADSVLHESMRITRFTRRKLPRSADGEDPPPPEDD